MLVCPQFQELTVYNHRQKRQKGGIGSAAYDPKQQDIRAFFGGGQISTTNHVHEEGRAESNAEDEADVQIE